MKKSIIILTCFISLFAFSQEGWQFYCDNESIATTVITSDVNDDGSIDECDYYSAGILACPNAEWVSYFLVELDELGCDNDIDSWVINDDFEDDNDNVNNFEDCEEGVLVSVGGGDWMNEVSWNITSCDGTEIIAEGGAPFSDCIVLPDFYIINMFDSYGDGWNGNIIYIDGFGEFSLESGIQDAISNSDDCIIDIINDNINNEEWFEFICNGEPIYSYMTEEEWYEYISTLDCEEFDSDFGSSWTPVFISFNSDPVEINDIGFEIYDCAGNLYLQAGAPYEGYTELPNDFTIVIVDYSGDGWSEGSSIYIDGYGEYTLESGYFDTISNCDDNDNNDNDNDLGGDDEDNVMNCEEGVLISVDGGVWQDEVSWMITDCDGIEIIAQGGAPYEDCIVLPENYVITMNDSWGDGWNGNYMTIGDAMYTLEYGPENVIAVGDCDINWWDGNNSNSDWDGEWNPDSYFTYECNGEIVTVTFDDTANTILDFNGDGIIDSSEILFYVSENYDCDEAEIDIFSDIWDDIIWNDSNWDLDILNWDDDFDWDMNNDGFDDFTWDDFDWDAIWDDYIFSDIDWENTPWGEVIDLGINPEDLINYLIELGDGRISAFDWRDFINYFNNTLPLDLENNILNEKYIIQSINILGQNVDRDCQGVIFHLYNDGSVEKIYISK